MFSNRRLDFLTRSDFLFGYTPSLLHNRRRRFQSRIGGIFCYVYLTILLVYCLILSLEYQRDDITGFTTSNSKNVASFYPALETDFDLAFGFTREKLPPDIGFWKVNHVRREWNLENTRSFEKKSNDFPERDCRHTDEFLTNN